MENNNNNRKLFRNPTWGNIVVIVLFTATVAGWFVGWGAQKERIKNIDKAIEGIKSTLKELELWQKEWPLKGELIMDRGQNTRLDDLTRRIENIEPKTRPRSNP